MAQRMSRLLLYLPHKAIPDSGHPSYPSLNFSAPPWAQGSSQIGPTGQAKLFPTLRLLLHKFVLPDRFPSSRHLANISSFNVICPGKNRWINPLKDLKNFIPNVNFSPK